jgi:hypothetical protein
LFKSYPQKLRPSSINVSSETEGKVPLVYATLVVRTCAPNGIHSLCWRHVVKPLNCATILPKCNGGIAAKRLLKAVRRPQARSATGCSATDAAHDERGILGIQKRGDFVAENHGRITSERAGKRKALLLSAAEGAHATSLHATQIDRVKAITHSRVERVPVKVGGSSKSNVGSNRWHHNLMLWVLEKQARWRFH